MYILNLQADLSNPTCRQFAVANYKHSALTDIHWTAPCQAIHHFFAHTDHFYDNNTIEEEDPSRADANKRKAVDTPTKRRTSSTHPLSSPSSV